MWWKVKNWEQSWKYCRRRHIRKRQFHHTSVAIDSYFVQIIKSCFKVICQIQSTEAFEICFRFLDVMWFDDDCNIVGTRWWLVLEPFTHRRIATMSKCRWGTGLSTFMILSAFDVLQLCDAVDLCTNSKFYTYISCFICSFGSVVILLLQQLHRLYKIYTSSAVAEIGDSLATIDIGRSDGGCCVPFRGGRNWVPI